MTAKKATTRKRKSVAPELVAAVLTHADLHSSDAAAAAQFGVSERSVKRWRAHVAAGRLPGVAQQVTQNKAAALGKHADLLDQVFTATLKAVEKKLEDPTNTLRSVVGAMKIAGELRLQRDLLRDDDDKPPGVRASSAGAEAVQDTAGARTGGAPGQSPGSGDTDPAGTKAPVH